MKFKMLIILFLLGLFACEKNDLSDDTTGNDTNTTIAGDTLYVNTNATGTNTGANWENAFTDLQDALTSATNGQQIWVAKGTYYPTEDNNRETSFQMVEGVNLYGGFVGNETSLGQRDYSNNITILSGDIGSQGIAEDNTYHIIQGSENSIIDGVYIENGYADGELTDGFGGGLFNYGHEMSVIVRNTTFQNNYGTDGGAIYNFYDAYAYFTNVTIKNNTANLGGAITC